jgi:hypothetical protein
LCKPSVLPYGAWLASPPPQKMIAKRPLCDYNNQAMAVPAG